MGSTFYALLNLCGRLGHTVSGTATGGSTTTLVDSSKGDYPNDFFNEGTLFILSGENALTSLKITDFATTSGTFTFAAVSEAITAGVRYLAMMPFYTRDELAAALNAALNEAGPLPKYEILTPSEDEQETYLMQGVYGVLKVETSSATDEPYDWEVNYHWQEVNNRLVFDSGKAPVFERLRVWYEAQHARVNADDDYVSDYIHPDRLAVMAARHAILNRMGAAQNNEPDLQDKLKLISSDADRLAVAHPIRRMARTAHLSVW